MATVTVAQPEPEPVPTEVVLNISVEQALELTGLLGTGQGIIEGLYFVLERELARAGINTGALSNSYVKRGRDLAPRGLGRIAT